MFNFKKTIAGVAGVLIGAFMGLLACFPVFVFNTLAVSDFDNEPLTLRDYTNTTIIAPEEKGEYNEVPLIRGRRNIHVQGGRFNEPFFSAPIINRNGNLRYQYALNSANIRDMTFFGVGSSFEADAIFDGGSNGSLYSGISTWYCKLPVFDMRSRPETTSASNTMNRFESCRFRHFDVATACMVLAWPQEIDSCFFENGVGKAITGGCPLNNVTTISNTTFERVGDQSSVIHWERGTLKLVNCRLGWCPDTEYYVTLGEQANLILVDTVQSRNTSPRNAKLCNRMDRIHILQHVNLLPAQ